MGIDIFNEKLTTFLFSKTRRSLLALLYGRPDETFYINQLMQATGAGSGAVQRELKLMTEAGILIRTKSGNQVYYQANPLCPIFKELNSLITKDLKATPSLSTEKGQGDEVIPLINIVRKTFLISPLSLDGRGTGERVSEVISQHFNVPKDRLAKYCRKHHIKKMSLFGSVLHDDFRPDSDIDILVEFEPGHVPGFAIIDMEAELSQLVGRKVDLRTANELSRYFRDKVVREAKVQYAAD